jgi:glycosyltransferase involved in cell wall biosynthesis
MANRGHDVTVATAFHPKRDFSLLNGVKIRQFRVSGTKAVGIRGEKEEYRRFLLNSDCDMVLNYGTNVWTTDLTFDILDELDCVKILVPVGYTPMASLIWRLIYARYYLELARFMKKYNKIVYHSGDYGNKKDYLDKVYGDKHGLTNYCVIPNAVSEREFKTGKTDFRSKYGVTSEFMLLTVGYHDIIKGHRFIIDAFNRTNRKDVTLVIIGNDAQSLMPQNRCLARCKKQAAKSDGKVLVLTNASREDTVAAFLDADVYLLGSKYECSPVVLLEAMASNTPFVSRNVGTASELKGGLIVNTRKQMAAEIQNLLDNPALRNQLASHGLREIHEKYNWERVGRLFEELFLSLLKRGETRNS